MTSNRSRARLQLAPRRRSPRQMRCPPGNRVTPQGGRRQRTSKPPVPGATKPARSLVPPPCPQRKDLRVKALLPLSGGSRPTQPRSREQSPSDSAPTGRSMRHPPTRRLRRRLRHGMPQLESSCGLTPKGPSDPPGCRSSARGRHPVGRAGQPGRRGLEGRWDLATRGHLVAEDPRDPRALADQPLLDDRLWQTGDLLLLRGQRTMPSRLPTVQEPSRASRGSGARS